LNQKKSFCGEGSFFQGVFEFCGVFVMVDRGEFVVGLMVNCGVLMGSFLESKNTPTFKVYFFACRVLEDDGSRLGRKGRTVAAG
jgi:hypothetical protein